MLRSQAATKTELLIAFFEHPEGIAFREIYKLVPNRHIPANMLTEMIDEGLLVAHPTALTSVDWWNTIITISFEWWVKLTQAAIDADRALGGSGTP